ncbi:MAG: hypothetical protein ACM3US_09895 [Sphingomonadaceae bacterium]
MLSQVIRRLIRRARTERTTGGDPLLEAALQACRSGARRINERRLEIVGRTAAMAAGSELAEDYCRVVSMLQQAETALNCAAGVILLAQVAIGLDAPAPGQHHASGGGTAPC